MVGNRDGPGSVCKVCPLVIVFIPSCFILNAVPLNNKGIGSAKLQQSLSLGGLSLGLLHEGKIGIGILPEVEEVLVDGG